MTALLRAYRRLVDYSVIFFEAGGRGRVGRGGGR